jgi:hypothetical protein
MIFPSDRVCDPFRVGPDISGRCYRGRCPRLSYLSPAGIAVLDYRIYPLRGLPTESTSGNWQSVGSYHYFSSMRRAELRFMCWTARSMPRGVSGNISITERISPMVSVPYQELSRTGFSHAILGKASVMAFR